MLAGWEIRRGNDGGASQRSFAVGGTLAVVGVLEQVRDTRARRSTTAAAERPPRRSTTIANTVPEDIKSSGKLIVGVNIPYTPNEFKDPSGKIVGFDVDLMNADRRPPSG